MSGSDHMLQALQGLLQQLEAAQGGEDPEARAHLNQLRQQLGALDQARQRAAAANEADAAGSSSAGGGDGSASSGSGVGRGSPLRTGINGHSGTGAATTAARVANDAASMLQQMEGLSVRLSGLENKLAHLDAGSRAVLVQSAGSWLGALQDGSGGGQGGTVGGADGVVVEGEEEEVNEEVAVAVETTGQNGSSSGGGSGA